MDDQNPKYPKTKFTNKQEGKAFLTSMKAKRISPDGGTPGITSHFIWQLPDGSKWSEFDGFNETRGDSESDYILQLIV